MTVALYIVSKQLLPIDTSHLYGKVNFWCLPANIPPFNDNSILPVVQAQSFDSSFSHPSHLICQEILLVLPPKYVPIPKAFWWAPCTPPCYFQFISSSLSEAFKCQVRLLVFSEHCSGPSISLRVKAKVCTVASKSLCDLTLLHPPLSSPATSLVTFPAPLS